MSYALLAVGGFLLGGAWSFRQQGRPVGLTVLLLALGMTALVLGVLQLS